MNEAGLKVTISKEDLEKGVDAINKKLLTIEKTMGEVTNKVGDLTKTAGLNLTQLGEGAGEGFKKGAEALKSLNKEFGEKANLQQYLDLLKQVEGSLDKISSTTNKTKKPIEKASALTDEQAQDIINGRKVNNLNIPQLQGAIATLNNQIGDTNSKLSISQQQKLVDLRSYYAEELKLSQKSTEEQKKYLDIQAEQLQRTNDKKLKSSKKLSEQTPLYDYSKVDISKIDAVNRSYNERTRLTKELTEYSRNLVRGTEEYSQKQAVVNKKIQELAVLNKNASTEGLKLEKTKRKILDTAGQLSRKIALLFSVSQITNFVKKMIMVRGEFELQQRALQAILQDKDAADKLFGQITQLGVNSPFKTSELISYTKQLAAYRIEEDKLYETTYRLADISAGLGVDMQRLILAFGQVKAANYLRGQELRQFSEAGINILGELAEQFSTVEGRAVSTGEVFERVSKRMVTFGDVEQVFKRLTDEGGIFYNMQEIQSETLKGKLLNLRDALDLMYNDIGKGNDGVLKNSVDIVRSMILNWEDLVYWIKFTVATLGIYKVTSIAAAFATKNLGDKTIWLTGITGNEIAVLRASSLELARMTVAQRAAYLSTVAWGRAMRILQGALTTLWTTVKSFIPAAVIMGVITLITKLTEASRQANRLNVELGKIKNESVSSFNESANSLKRLGEQLKNVTKGTSEHKEVLGKLNKEFGDYIPYLLNENTALNSIADSYDVILLKMKQVAQQRAYDKGVLSIENEYGDIESKRVQELQDFIITYYKDYGASISDAAQITKMWREGLKGTIDDAAALQDIAYKYFTGKNRPAVDFSLLSPEQVRNLGIINNKILTIAGTFTFMNNQYKKLDDEISGTFGANFSTKEVNDKIKSTTESFQKLFDTVKTGTKEWDNINKQFKTALLEIKKNAGLITNFKYVTDVLSLDKLDKTFSAINKKLEEYPDYVRDALYVPTTVEPPSQTEYMEQIEGQWQALKESVARRKRQQKQDISLVDVVQLDKDKKQIAALEDILKIIGYDFPKTTNETKNKVLELTKEQIAAINEVIKKYDEYLKVFSIDASRELIRKDFSGLFKTLGLELLDTADLSEKWAIDLLKGLSNKLRDAESKKAIEAALRDIELKVNISFVEGEINTAQKKFDKLIEDFKLTSELKDLNLPTSWVSMIFGDEITTLADIKTKGEKIIYDLMSAGVQDRVAKAQEIGLKLKEIEADTWKENIKIISEAAKKYQNVSIAIENVKNKYDELIEWVKQNIPEAEQGSVIANLLSMSDSQIAELQAEAFKATDIYAKMFGDIKDYGYYTLNYLIGKAKEMTGEFSDITNVGAKFIKQDGTTKVSMSWKDEAGNIQQATVSLEEYRSVLKQIRKMEDEVIGDNLFSKSIAGWADVANASDTLRRSNELLKKQKKELIEAEEKLHDLIIQNARESVSSGKPVVEGSEEYAAYIEKQKQLAQTEAENKQLSSDKWESISHAVHSTADEINNLINSYSFLGDLLGETGKQFISSFTELSTVVVDIVGSVEDLAKQSLDSAKEISGSVSNLAKTSSIIMLIVKAVLIIIEYVYKALDSAGSKIRKEIDLIDKEIDYLDGMSDRIDFDLLNNITEKEVLKRELNSRLQIIEEFQSKYAQTADELSKKAKKASVEGLLSSLSLGTTSLVSAVENAINGDWSVAWKDLANSLTLGVVGWVEGLIKLSREKKLSNWLDTLAVKEEYIIKLNEILNSNLTDLQKSAEATAANLDYQIGKLTEKYERYQELAEKGKAKEEDLDAMEEAEQELFDKLGEKAMLYANTISEKYGDIFNNLADGITSALEGAFDNITDPAKAFEEAWSEAIKSVIFNMLKVNYIMPQLQEWMKSFYLSMGLNADGSQRAGIVPDMILTPAEASALRSEYENVVGITQQAWDSLLSTLEILGVTSTSEMSDLSRGIQGVSEREAEALEALLNSIRYRIFSHYNFIEPRIDTIIDKLTINNTYCQQILLDTGAIKSTLNSMLSAFRSVLTQQPSNGVGIRVYANM